MRITQASIMPSFNLFETLSIVFIIQVSSYLLFLFKKPVRKSDFLLASFLAIFVLIILNLFIRFRWNNQIPYPYFEYISILAPLQYFYVRSVTRQPISFSPKNLIHLSGFLVILFARLFFYGLFPSNDPSFFEQILFFPLFIYAFSYLGFSMQIIHSFHQVILSTHSSYDKLNLKWLRYELVILGIIFICLGTESLRLFLPLGELYETIVLLAFIGILLFINILIFKSLNLPIQRNNISIEDQQITYQQKVKYKGSNLKEDKSRQYFLELKKLMENEKPYQQFELSLSELSQMVNLSPAIVSQVINENAQVNFNDFINQYRVEEAKRLLSFKKNDMLIKEIMYKSGFQSTSTFNQAFKRNTGLSPSAYRVQKPKS